VASIVDFLKSDIDSTIKRYDAEFNIPQALVELCGVDKNVLAHKIMQIPNDYLTMMFLKYYFKLDHESISALTKKSYIAGHLHYINELLCFAMGLPEKSYLHPDTLSSACRIAFNKYCMDKKEDTATIAPKYSHKYRRTMKMIPAARKSHSLLAAIGRRVAIFALIVVLAFTASLAVNAEMRERFFEWIRRTFSEFTEFGAAPSSNMADGELYARLPLIRPHYIPDGFYLLDEPFHARTFTTRTYVDGYGNMITFMVAIPEGSLTAYDTEGVVVEEIEFLGQPAFIWENQGVAYFVWQQDGLKCSVVANLPINKVVEIANSVSIPKY